MGDSTTTIPHKVFTVNNIKSHIPIILDPALHNYDAWRGLFLTHCLAYDAKDHVDETFDPPQTRPTTAEWKKIDAQVSMWMYLTMTQDLIRDVFNIEASARQTWIAIENYFRDNKDSRILQTDRELRDVSMGDSSVQNYCARVKSLANILENLDKDSKVPDKNLVIYTINGLSPRFDYVASIIRHKKNLPSFNDCKSMLLLEEQRLNSAKPLPPVSANTNHTSSPSILYAGSQNSSNHRRPAGPRRPSAPSQQNPRPPQPASSYRPPPPPQPYGWSYHAPPPMPPPAWTHASPHVQNNWSSPPFAYGPPPSLLGPAPNFSHFQQPTQYPGPAYLPQAHATAGPSATGPQPNNNSFSPPWAWFGSNQATSLPHMFSSMGLEDPHQNNWAMDSGATDHVHKNEGKMADKSQLQGVAGVAFQMQRKLLWFKEVASMIPPHYKEEKNVHGLTPQELFTENHKALVDDGVQWVKRTASKSMVVAALIATIVFAVAYTIPGGYEPKNGFPAFIHNGPFLGFAVLDAISFILSSISILVFLSILTSRYTQEDFRDSLPRYLLAGLSMLFFSVVTMMISFSVSFFVLLAYVHALILMVLYAQLQYPLLKDVYRSARGSGNLFKPKKQMLNNQNPSV